MELTKYLGIPFLPHGRNWKGCDCWGLVRLIYKEEVGMELPSLTTEYDELNPLLLEKVVDNGKSYIEYEEIDFENLKELDILLFYQYGKLSHVGLYIGKNQFLHTNNKIGTVIESLTYHNKRNLEGAYRVCKNNCTV